MYLTKQVAVDLMNGLVPDGYSEFARDQLTTGGYRCVIRNEAEQTYWELEYDPNTSETEWDSEVTVYGVVPISTTVIVWERNGH